MEGGRERYKEKETDRWKEVGRGKKRERQIDVSL